MEQLFKMPIKRRLNFRVEDHQSTDQITLNGAFQYFLLVSISSSTIFPDF